MTMSGKPGKERQDATSATRVLHRVAGDSRRMRDLLERERLNAAVARQIYEARAARGLSQAQLAKLVGTTQSAIARLEDADYEGHSLSMLRRIAEALGYDVEIRLVEHSNAA
jgi:ribosome-binding protein aMBF1 (putative translation factor)